MAKVDKSKIGKRAKQEVVLPLQRENFIIIGIGLLFIIAGYLALSGNTVESFSQLTVAPILLLIGYLVVIPFGIMYRKKVKQPAVPETPAPVQKP